MTRRRLFHTYFMYLLVPCYFVHYVVKVLNAGLWVVDGWMIEFNGTNTFEMYIIIILHS